MSFIVTRIWRKGRLAGLSMRDIKDGWAGRCKVWNARGLQICDNTHILFHEHYLQWYCVTRMWKLTFRTDKIILMLPPDTVSTQGSLAILAFQEQTTHYLIFLSGGVLVASKFSLISSNNPSTVRTSTATPAKAFATIKAFSKESFVPAATWKAAV